MDVQMLRGLEPLRELKPAWENLESHAFLPMQDYAWMESAATALKRDADLQTVVIKRNGDVAAIAPLILSPSKRSLELLGVSEFLEPANAIYSDDHAGELLAAALSHVDLPLVLKRIPVDSVLPGALVKRFRQRGGMLIRRPDMGWPWIPLDENWQQPEMRLQSGRRSDFRRSQRRAQEAGTVSVEIVSPTAETLSPLLDEAFAVEAASWKGESGTAVALDPVREPFYRRYAAAACQRGILRLCFLRIGGKAAAMQVAIQSKGRFWLLKIGYDKQFARCSPGNLLLRETIAHAAREKLSSYEFLGTLESWISLWSDQQRTCEIIRGYPLGLRGVTTLAGDAFKSVWHKLEHASSK